MKLKRIAVAGILLLTGAVIASAQSPELDELTYLPVIAGGCSTPEPCPVCPTPIPLQVCPTTPPPQVCPTFPPPTPVPAQFTGPGMWLVGPEIQAGTYRIEILNEYGCWWERLSCLTGDWDCKIEFGYPQGSSYVTIVASDLAFELDDECSLTKIELTQN